MSKTGFWDNREGAQTKLKERSDLSDRSDLWKTLNGEVEENKLLLELVEAEHDDGAIDELSRDLAALERRMEEVKLEFLLRGEHDESNAIVSIHPGAGGTESQDWAEMLMRMYLRWCERKKYKVKIEERLPGEEAGIKSVTFSVEGKYAFGYLKSEAGVHRLVRISPFDANKRRHTSFASVFVYPEIDEAIEVNINPDELRIDTYRASGAGGQHVNVTDSAVRITHIPSNLVVSCQNERSQHQNKDTAMKILRARLYDYRKREQGSIVDELHAGKKDNAWGNQIRSYVFQPYQMVKDHRTQAEKGDINSVFNGSLDYFIEAYLKWCEKDGK